MTLPGYVVHDRFVLETVSRRESKAVFVGDSTLLCRVLGTYFLYADSNDLGIAPHFALNGYWESNVTLALARAAKSGSWCLDIGANHGYFTLVLAAATGPKGHVAAVEPNPRSVDLMTRSLDVNGFLGHVDVVAAAISDSRGEPVRFYIPPHRGMNALIFGDGRTEGARRDDDRDDNRDDRRLDGELAPRRPREDRRRGIRGGGLARHAARPRREPDITVVLEVNAARYEEPVAFLREIEAAGFALRHIDVDGEPRAVTVDEIARTEHDWMLYLRRDPE
jgi:FkbM family methyltransferase